MRERGSGAQSSDRSRVEARLFVAPGEPSSRLAERNLRRLLDEHPRPSWVLSVVDAPASPAAAAAAGIVVLPTLVVHGPGGRRLIPGRLSDPESVLAALAAPHAAAPQAEAGAVLSALRRAEVDAVLGEDDVLLLRPLADERSLWESRQRLETLAEATFEGVAVTEEGRYLDVNSQMATMFGYTRDEMIGMEVAELIAPEDRDRVMGNVLAGVEGLVRFQARRHDGTTFVAESQNRMLLHEGRRIRVSAIRDVTHHIRSEEELRRAHDELERTVEERTADLARLNLILQMIIDCNEAIVRAATEQELLQEVCRIVVEVGGYRMAWVGMAEHDAAKTVRPAASVGFEDGYLSRIRISWADEEVGRGPTGTAIRTGTSTVGDDFLHDEELAPWREEAVKRGFRSSVALPLANGDRVFGSLTLYSPEPHAFDEESLQVLEELAEDLAFGITALRTQAERDEARQAAEERARQLQALAQMLGRAEQEERRRLARLLHDHLQQLLVAARYGATAIQQKAPGEALRQTATHVVEALDEAVQAARSLTAELSPTVLHERGLGAGLEWLAEQVRAKHGLAVAVTVDPDAEPRADEVRSLLYESVRELLFNVVKHAGVDRAEVRTRALGDGRIEITVADAGAGFDPARLDATGDGSGFGLFGIRERMGFLGGEMEIDSAPGGGSRFILRVPMAIEPPSG